VDGRAPVESHGNATVALMSEQDEFRNFRAGREYVARGGSPRMSVIPVPRLLFATECLAIGRSEGFTLGGSGANPLSGSPLQGREHPRATLGRAEMRRWEQQAAPLRPKPYAYMRTGLGIAPRAATGAAPTGDRVRSSNTQHPKPET
jgi:hypothetical protein